MKRKEFIRQMGAVALLTGMGITLESCEKEEAPTPDENAKKVTFDISTGDFVVLQNNDGWLLHPSENMLLVNIGGTIRALTSVCTHNGCSTNWSYNRMEFRCGCHGAKFTNLGTVVQGPAQTDLKQFAVAVNGTLVTVTI